VRVDLVGVRRTGVCECDRVRMFGCIGCDGTLLVESLREAMISLVCTFVRLYGFAQKEYINLTTRTVTIIITTKHHNTDLIMTFKPSFSSRRADNNRFLDANVATLFCACNN